MYRFLSATDYDSGDSPVDLADLIPAPTGTGSTGAVQLVLDSHGTVSGHLVPTSTATEGVELKADAQYEVGPLRWPGTMPHLYLPAGAEVRVNVFVSAIAP